MDLRASFAEILLVKQVIVPVMRCLSAYYPAAHLFIISLFIERCFIPANTLSVVSVDILNFR